MSSRLTTWITCTTCTTLTTWITCTYHQYRLDHPDHLDYPIIPDHLNYADHLNHLDHWTTWTSLTPWTTLTDHPTLTTLTTWTTWTTWTKNEKILMAKVMNNFHIFLWLPPQVYKTKFYTNHFMAIPIAVQSYKIYFLEFPYMTKTKDALTNTSEVDIWSRYLFHSDPFCRLQKHGWGKPELFPNLLFYPKSRSKTPSSVRLFH